MYICICIYICIYVFLKIGYTPEQTCLHGENEVQNHWMIHLGSLFFSGTKSKSILCGGFNILDFGCATTSTSKPATFLGRGHHEKLE